MELVLSDQLPPLKPALQLISVHLHDDWTGVRAVERQLCLREIFDQVNHLLHRQHIPGFHGGLARECDECLVLDLEIFYRWRYGTLDSIQQIYTCGVDEACW